MQEIKVIPFIENDPTTTMGHWCYACHACDQSEGRIVKCMKSYPQDTVRDFKARGGAYYPKK